ncbi:hypothetical protein ANPL_04285 [Anaplasma platys]|uniref:Uncharacterized protein n=1 Tax=Anaplasma platys TaxID=949 RepID=A0A858PZ60_9RICK|nr:hypothetical protein ANPL_04285 [Anaplasma platys]
MYCAVCKCLLPYSAVHRSKHFSIAANALRYHSPLTAFFSKDMALGARSILNEIY